MSRVSLNVSSIPSMSIMSDSGNREMQDNSETSFSPPSYYNTDGQSSRDSDGFSPDLQPPSSPSPPAEPLSNGSAAKNVNSNEEDDSHDVEPRFKYDRLLGDRNEGISRDSSRNILSTDSATVLAVHEKMLALGTKSGRVHILDLLGYPYAAPA